MIRRGYKAYNKGLINQFGEHHEIGHVYETDDIIYGKKGYYFCPNIEDTLRFYNGLEEEIDIAWNNRSSYHVFGRLCRLRKRKQ